MSSGKWAILITFMAAIVIAIAGYFSIKNLNDTYMPLRTPLSSKISAPDNIRPTAVAGAFYPDDPVELNKMIDEYLNAAPTASTSGTPRIIISPHAGYIYSGRVAAAAFKAVAGKDFERVVIVGRSHNQYFSGIAADGHSAWETPLGDVAIDTNFIARLQKAEPAIMSSSSPHDPEHSLEVMVPFIIKTLGADVKIVPLLFGDDNPDTETKLAKALGKIIDEKTLIVISSDLSHYPPYDLANKLDKQTIEAILAGDVGKFHKQLGELLKKNSDSAVTLACGETAIAMAMTLAKDMKLTPNLIQYGNSGDFVAESKTQGVVGYAAITFNQNNMNEDLARELNNEEQKIALTIARETLETAFAKKAYTPDTKEVKIFDEKRGAFVTLRINGALRGCIGLFEPDMKLSEVIKEMATAAAFEDGRFTPLTADELDKVDIEISVLTPMKKISSVDAIEMGTHGVYIKRGARSGVFLPQVATETGWDKNTFLNSLCTEKAGLEPGCWRDANTEVFVFTAQVFN
jgi:AmmeMemoRadiSam system protein B/AmmeMemoRadiSam system protein A